VTLTANDAKLLSGKIAIKLQESNVTELKWKSLDSAKYRFAAEKVINCVFEYVELKHLRIDTMIWDIKDSRHDVRGRDDAANLGRMYFHLLKNVLKNRWPDDAVWNLCPDEHNHMDWDTLHEVLDFKSVIAEEINLLNTADKKVNFPWVLKSIYNIKKIEPCKSDETTLVQLADLFAGMACFSKEHFNDYMQWYADNNSQPSLFSQNNSKSLSNAQKERFPIIKMFDSGCKKRGLGVSLKSSGALTTKDPQKPINFWWYTPQTEQDRAPVKVK